MFCILKFIICFQVILRYARQSKYLFIFRLFLSAISRQHLLIYSPCVHIYSQLLSLSIISRVFNLQDWTCSLSKSTTDEGILAEFIISSLTNNSCNSITITHCFAVHSNVGLNFILNMKTSKSLLNPDVHSSNIRTIFFSVVRFLTFRRKIVFRFFISHHFHFYGSNIVI